MGQAIRGRAEPGADHRCRVDARDTEGAAKRTRVPRGMDRRPGRGRHDRAADLERRLGQRQRRIATWVTILKIVLGLLLVLLAVEQWRGRPRGDDEPELPAWMKTIDTFTQSSPSA